MKIKALISIGITFFLTTIVLVVSNEIPNLIEYLTHQGVLVAMNLFLVTFTICLPYLKWYKRNSDKASIWTYSAWTSVFGSLASIMLVFLFTLFLSVLVGGGIAELPSLIAQLLPQIFQVGTIFVTIQWFIFGLVFYTLTEVGSKAKNK